MNKNVMIGGLLAIVLAMAVGYAAFSTTLNINGTANITGKWNVGFDTTKTSAVVGTAGLTGAATEPSGTIAFTDAQNANLNATLIQPGDTVTFTMTVKNDGNLTAKLANPTLSVTSANSSIDFAVSNPVTTTLAAGSTTTFTVTATFKSSVTSATGTESATAKVTINATQAS